ncbi:autotransporter-associated beta strand repeat-containing protein [Adhaeretor mobilis]|uniref:Autotransporter-associated beta strand repeat protein n=1 Tax=Adhaeretor mobilis TaxID=1930276 RepID=A0A517MQ72_9BACT|nr:autotransporter-associated beta strand repeat-containing protein [Adhaeretor mobilis]QDS97036.1 Autotransporter-associated beta strand repeat protein [Adhaeretor mobilis]
MTRLLTVAAFLLSFSSTVRAQRAYFSLQGTIPNGSAEIDFGFDIERSVSKPEFFRFETDSWAGGTNAAGDVISATGFDSELELFLGAASTLALSNEIDDGGSGEPDFDALISWDNVQTIGDPLPNTLAAGFPYRLELRGVNNDTGAWSNELVGPADALEFTGAIGMSGGTISSLKFGTTGAGTTPATYNHSVGSGNLDLTGDLVIANTGNAVLDLSSETISVGGTATINSGGTVSITGSGTLDAPGGVNLNGGQIVMNNTTGLQGSTVILNADNGLDITTNSVNATLGGLAGVGSLDLGGQIVTSGAVGGDTTYAGRVTGTNVSRLRHNGAGVLTLTGGTNANPSTFGTLSADGSTGGLVVDGARIDLTSTVLSAGSNTAVSAVDGEITLTGGADVGMPATSIAITRSGTLTLTGAGTSLSGHRFQGTAAGALIVEENASLQLNNTLAFGVFGSASTTYDFQVRSGGNVSVASLGISDTADTRADAVVTGAGSQLSVSSILKIGFEGSTAAGAVGTLSVEQGAAVDVTGVTRLTNSGSSLTIDVGTFETGELRNDAGTTPTVSLSDPAGDVALTVGTANQSSTFGGTIQDAASGPGSLKKIGAGTFTLTGANTYTGDTIIDAGTLSIAQSFLADAADVHLLTGATFDLDFLGTDLIDELFIDGSSEQVGTHGAIGSGADFQWSLFSGTGLLEVSTFSGIPGDFDADDDVDGLDFLSWQRNPAIGSLADWESNYGTSTSALAASQAVPEPAAWVLLVAAWAPVVHLRRLRS